MYRTLWSSGSSLCNEVCGETGARWWKDTRFFAWLGGVTWTRNISGLNSRFLQIIPGHCCESCSNTRRIVEKWCNMGFMGSPFATWGSKRGVPCARCCLYKLCDERLRLRRIRIMPVGNGGADGGVFNLTGCITRCWNSGADRMRWDSLKRNHEWSVTRADFWWICLSCLHSRVSSEMTFYWQSGRSSP